MVPAETPALETIATAVKVAARLILVTDTTDEVMGFVAPDWLKHQVFRHRGSYDLLQGLRDMEADPAEILRGFHHEWLTQERPTLHWCALGNHMTDENPCSKHGV